MNILCCGVFDLIHIGHIRFLNKIKKINDTLIILIHSDRFVATYKRQPIINENQRLELIQNIKCVDKAFIDDNEYLTQDSITTYNINKVIQATNDHNSWSYYYHIPMALNIMDFINYNNIISTTNIIHKIQSITGDDYNDRYTKENILKSEKLYGYGWQSVDGESILENIVPKNKYKNILEIGSGLGGNSNYLSNKYNGNITALDISKHMIDICNERNTNTNIKYILTDYKDFSTDNTYDLILCRDVFMYCHTEQTYNHLKKIKSQLIKGGIFILIDYCRGDIENKDFTTYCMNRKWNIINIPFYKKLLTDVGFTLLDDSNISNNYIDFLKQIPSDIDIHVKDNLHKKITYLKNNNFEWHYFVLTI